MFQLFIKRYEYYQYRRGFKERDRIGGFFYDYGYDDYYIGVYIGDGGGQNYQYIYVGGFMSESFEGLDVEVSFFNKLKEIRRCVIYCVRYFLLNSKELNLYRVVL